MSPDVGVTLTKSEKARRSRSVLPAGALLERGSAPVDRVLAHAFWAPPPEAHAATPISIDAFRRR